MNSNSGKAIYLQLADRIMDSILSGEYAVQQRIPSVREYAATVEVNANTVMRTYDYLQQSDVIFNKRGIGFFIADNAPETILALRRGQFFDSEIPYFFSRLSQFGTSPDELKQSYQQFLDKKA